MVDESLVALSPLDGRYVTSTQSLRPYFSEFALMKYRIMVELRYLAHLSKWKIVRSLKPQEKVAFEKIIKDFSLTDAKRIKTFESETKHDVKALEYFLKEKLEKTSAIDLLPFVHFGLTSEDVNTLSYALMLAGSHTEVIMHELSEVLDAIYIFASLHVKSAMVARTHGQPAVPTTFGKELAVFYERLKKCKKRLTAIEFEGKLNGAVGNYNAVAFIYPTVDWLKFSREFITSLGLAPNLITNQIIPSDNWVEYFQLLGEINTILIGLSQDMWQYISRGLVLQKKDPKQVGSSTMPQKINPIDFENAEGNFQIANAYIELYARKLLVSRMQRDLTDSTVKRTFGSALGHTLLAYKSLKRGLGKSMWNEKGALEELDAHWEILAEAVQVYMKVAGDAQGYEKVKAMMMGKTVDAQLFAEMTHAFPPLAKLTPRTYSGLVEKIARLALKKK